MFSNKDKFSVENISNGGNINQYIVLISILIVFNKNVENLKGNLENFIHWLEEI